MILCFFEAPSLAPFGTSCGKKAALKNGAKSVQNDLVRHGEHRGVEVILVGLNVSIEGSECHVSAEAGIADRNSRMLLMLDATIELP